MSINPLDFDHDGDLDPIEAFVGANYIMSLGYGAGLSDAELYKYDLEEEYDEKLKKLERHNRELEDKLSSFDRDYKDASFYDDDYDEDDDAFFEEYYSEDYLKLDEDELFGIDEDYANPDNKVIIPVADDITNAAKTIEKHTYVAGIKYGDCAKAWLLALTNGNLYITLKRDPHNEHDSNAVAVLVSGKLGGFLPANLVKDFAPAMDMGTRAKVTEHAITIKADSNNHITPKITVSLTVQFKDDEAKTNDE